MEYQQDKTHALSPHKDHPKKTISFIFVQKSQRIIRHKSLDGKEKGILEMILFLIRREEVMTQKFKAVPCD